MADWEEFCNEVNGGHDYRGETVTMTADVGPVSTMAGGGDGSDIVFRGTFDGQGHTLTFNPENATEQYIAPFRRIDGATIKDIKLGGSVSSNERFAGGIVAYAKGTSTVTNCVNSTHISNLSSNTNASNGGIVGMVGASGNLTITGCVFNGRMSGTTSNDAWCGILGLCNTNCTATINDCLVDPESSVSYGNTIYRNGENGTTTCSNCYYTKTIGTAQGKLARSITSGEGVTVTFAGTPSSGTTVGVIGYGTGIKYNGTLYAGYEDVVSLNVTAPTGYVIGTVTYTPEDGTATVINPTDGIYSFTMPDANVTLNATFDGFSKEIAGYGNGNGGWAFIASPVAESIAPSDVTNLIGNAIPGTNPVAYDFDLYRFNQSALKEWENYHAHTDGFNLVNGMGYLYATKETKTLVFTGTFNSDTEKTITGLQAGYNLVGNPFTVDATIDKSYYTLDGTGSIVVATPVSGTTAIAPCTGVIVQSDSDNRSVTFTAVQQQSANNTNNKGNLHITLSQETMGRGTTGREALMDNAIVSFNEGSQLGKFYFGEQNANIYLPQGGEAYAIAYSDKQGEMPLNFKANENGTYTLTINPEGVEVGYLHLIDNKTGADVDLLSTQNVIAGEDPQSLAPSYTFTAKTTDYESRFKLVFAAADEAVCGPSEAYAFISDGNLIVNGTGTLQVIDMLGRQLSSQEIHSSFSIQHSAFPTGVYVLRLINGDNVKVQKIVLK